MTIQELAKELSRLGINMAYYTFGTDNPPKIPYLVYYVEGRNDIIADNINYIVRENVEIQLYTETVDFDLADQLEEILRENELVFDCIPFTWIASANIYMTSYNITI